MNLTEADKKEAVDEAQRIINEANPYLTLPPNGVLKPYQFIDFLKDLRPSKNLIKAGLAGFTLGLTWGLFSGYDGALALADFLRLSVCGISGMVITSTYHGIYTEYLRDSFNIG